MLMLKTVTVLEAISKRRRTARPAAHTACPRTPYSPPPIAPRIPSYCSTPWQTASPPSTTTGRLDAVGPNTIEAPTKTLARRIADAFIDPFAGMFAALALVSLYIDVLAVPEPQRDPSTVIVIGVMLLVSGSMKFTRKPAAAMRPDP